MKYIKRIILVFFLLMAILTFLSCKDTKTTDNVWNSDKFLEQYDNFQTEINLLLSFNYNTTICGSKDTITDEFITDYLKTAVTPAPLYSVYKTYLLETELGIKFETVGDYEKNLIPKDLVKDVILQLFNIDESKINWQDFTQKEFEVEGRPDYFGIIVAFSGAYYDAEILYDTLVYSPDTNIVTFNIKFYEFGTEPERSIELCTLKYKFSPFIYKDKIQQYKFISVERVS